MLTLLYQLFQEASAAERMATTKPRTSDRAAAAFNDDLSCLDAPTFGKPKKGARKSDREQDEAAKKAKSLASKKVKTLDVPSSLVRKETPTLNEKAKGLQAGKTRFYRESVCVTQGMLDTQL